MAKVKKFQVHNNTPFTEQEMCGFSYIGTTCNNWRARSISLYQHPTLRNSVVSIGRTYDGSMVVYSVDDKSAWATALDYCAQGKMYVSE